ncbi:MAG TPA: Rne/Rng family ribonuclease [Actinomycetota bacterium]
MDDTTEVRPESAPAKTAAEATGDGAVADGTGAPKTGNARRRRRGGRGRGGGGARPAATSTGGEAANATADPSAERAEPADGAATTTTQAPRQRQPQKPKPAPSDDAPAATTPDAPTGATAEGTSAGAGTAGGPARKRRRRGGRGRGGKKPAMSATGAEASDTPDAPDATPATQREDAQPDAEAGTAPTASTAARSRSRSRSRSSKPATADAGAAEGGKPAPVRSGSSQESLEERVAAGGPTRGIRSSRSRTGRDGRRRRESLPTPPRITDKVMVITEHEERDQIAVLEENVLVQHYVTRIGATSMVGNVYLGRVQNVLPGMEAAFVDVGRGRNGVLYAGEVNYNPEDVEGPAPRIEQLLKPGQPVMVQVTKDPMGGKGARLTANLSLAGRYLVLAPNQDLQGISRRLGEDARKRLKAMLKRVKPAEHGVIVRTAAEGASEEALETDLRRLLGIWEQIRAAEAKTKAPAVLYEEPELTVRVVRDLFTDEEFKSLVTDSPRVYDRIGEYVREVAPDLAPKVHLHDGKLSAFEEHRVVEQIHKALDKKVWLPSGGYLFIERTEAMTIIDVNTGKSVGKTNLEETVVNTNLEAAREVARQLRLRDIGGIIVIDFIDMLLEKNKKQVEDTMREALALDKTRSQVYEIGPLGLMQVTRKRVSSGLVESFSETCPTCEGRGILLTYDVN